MDSIFSILGDKDFDEPPEIGAVKKYIRDEYDTEVGVMIHGQSIIISVSSAALANTLRLRAPEMKRRLQIYKRLSFRIS
jgi:hypothetical protein